VQGVFFSVGDWQTGYRPSSMQELPARGQSAASTHWVRHLPNAQISPEEQSLLREQPTVEAAVEVVHAGAARADANASPIRHAVVHAQVERSGLCVIHFIDSPP
jgi:hypothetical protein